MKRWHMDDEALFDNCAKILEQRFPMFTFKVYYPVDDLVVRVEIFKEGAHKTIQVNIPVTNIYHARQPPSHTIVSEAERFLMHS